jgi:hypothetical protein
MAQHDYVIANQSGSSFRSDLNNALSAIVSQNSGSSAPSTTYAYQTWADTTNGVMKMRNGANSAWITLYQLDGEWTSIAFENGTAAAPSIYFKDSGTDTGFYSPGTDQVGISTGGSSRLVIDSSGRVLTGVSSTSADTLALMQGRSGSSTGDGVLFLARGSAPGTNGNPLGTLQFSDSGHVSAARIQAIRDGASYASGSNQPSAITLSTTASGSATLTEQLRITSDRYVRLASGSGGIQFGGDTAAANALNDYEEGTWTVNFYDAATAGNASATTATGYYTKVGNLCTMTFNATNISTSGLTATNAFFYSLPFTSKSSVNSYGVTSADTLTFTSGYVGSAIGSAAARGFMVRTSTAAADANIIVSNFSTGVTDLRVTITYQTA